MTVLVAGIGNIFLGDDAFGVEVVRRLGDRQLPDGVQVVDFGIRGFDLANALIDSRHSAVVLVDAVPRGGEPGTLYLLEADAASEVDPPELDPHDMHPAAVLQLVRALRATPPHVFVLGCEPQTLDPDDGGQMSLSPAVAAAVDEAVQMLEELLAGTLERDSARCMR